MKPETRNSYSMFTGIVERTARVSETLDSAGSRLLRLDVEERAGLPVWRPAAPGESIALNGVCLTVVENLRGASAGDLSFEVVPETLKLTTLGSLCGGDEVNLERSLRVGDPLGGHYVSGHVDGVGRVRRRLSQGDQVLFEIEVESRLLREILRKGSVAVDGISLTVVEVERAAGWFSFAAIPHTLERTALKHRRVGSHVNVETDAFGKWVLHALGETLGGEPGPERLRDLLKASGFIGPPPGAAP
jgi:riboflavin synthase